jgi:hypothetical protein
MSAEQIAVALEILKEHPDIVEYIKTFDSPHGFMYTIECNTKRQQLQQKTNELLDDGSHSGASWGLFLRQLQAIVSAET